MVLGATTPEVKGTPLIEDAPENATEVVLGLGVREVALGFSTLRRRLAPSFQQGKRTYASMT